MTAARRIAWITGAGKGIGRALALRLVHEGWTIAASARTASDLEDLAARVVPACAVHPFVLDVTDPVATEAVVGDIEVALGPIDLVVLNAGTYVPTGVTPFNAAAFRTQFDVNVMGVVHGLAAIVPILVARRRGHIAVMSSVAGYRGLPAAAGYGATKAALINLCESLKTELEPHGVAVSVICPGFVKTPLTDKNDFPMPFLIEADEAAQYITRGLAARKFEIAFPPLFALLMKTLRFLPDALFFAVSRRTRPREY